MMGRNESHHKKKSINITESPAKHEPIIVYTWKSWRTFKEEKQTKQKQKHKNKNKRHINNPFQKYTVAVDNYDLISKW